MSSWSWPDVSAQRARLFAIEIRHDHERNALPCSTGVWQSERIASIMLKFRPSAAFRCIAALAVILGLLVLPAGIFATHGIAATAPEVSDHLEHGHHESVALDRDTDHAEGHNPADHSHETAFVLLSHPAVVATAGRNWLAVARSFTGSETASQLDRPPRPIFAP